jgi:hypothetical protein
MTSSSSRRRRLALAAAAATLAAGACIMTAVLARPVTVASGVLGAEWQCQRVAWVTSCTRVQPEVPAAVRVAPKEPVPRRPV